MSAASRVSTILQLDEALTLDPPGNSPRRVACGYLVATLPAWLLALDGFWAAIGGWRSESRLDQLIGIVVGVWLATATLLLSARKGREFYGRNNAQLILLALSACVAWIVAESVLPPVLERIEGPFHGRRPGTTIEYRPRQEIMPGVGPVAHVRFNDRGVRGEPMPARENAYRILCLGGSSTACTYLDDNKTWPTRLADDLNDANLGRVFWVGNAGIPGFRSEHHLQFLEKSPLVDDVDCVLVQLGINDFMACLAGPRPAPPRWTQSRVYRLARAAAQPANRSGTQIEDAAGTVYERRRAMRAKAPLANQSPLLDACLNTLDQRLTAMIEACRRRKVRLVFTTQPTLWRTDLEPSLAALLWFGELPDGRFLSIEQLRASMDRYNDTVRAACQRTGVGLIDLSSLDGRQEVFYDDCHFTEAGAEQVARLIADWFVAHPAKESRASQ